MSESDSIQVAVRVRPFNTREKKMNAKCCVKMDGPTTVLINPETGAEKKFTFDYSYWSFSPKDANFASQDTVYNDIGKGVLDNAFKGYNCSLFAYGQTGSGKSYSMVGYGEAKGIIPLACAEIFKRIDDAKKNGSTTKYRVEMTMIEIYNEKVRDLLNPKSNPRGGMRVREHPKTGPYVEGLVPTKVDNYEEIDKLMEEGSKARTVGSTKMNQTSSRAHTLVTVIFSQITTQGNKEMKKVSKINLVDLAGSEKLSQTGAQGSRMKEGININKSLSSLGSCISALAEKCSKKGKKKDKVFIPYRNSKLTFIMKESLGGNSKTAMIAAISPASVNFEESLSTLKYADRAKKIKTTAKVNEDPTAKLIKDLRAEIEELKKALAQKGGGASGVQDYSAQIDHLSKLIEQNTMTDEERKEVAEKQDLDRKNYLNEFGIVDFDKGKQTHLLNLNEDPSLSEKLLYPVKNDGKTTFGKTGDVQIGGDDIKDIHATITSQGSGDDEVVTIVPGENCDVYVNGQALSEKTIITHRDRIVFGSSQFFCLIQPSKANKVKGKVVDFESCINELAKNMAAKQAKGLIEETKRQHEEEAKALREQISKLKKENNSEKDDLLKNLQENHKKKEEELLETLKQQELEIEIKLLDREKAARKTVMDEFAKNCFKKIENQKEFTNLLMMTIAECRNLKAADVLTRSSDPYVTIEIFDKHGKKVHEQRTRKIMRNLNPYFNESHVFRVQSTDKMVLTVWDWDRFTKDDFLGSTEIDISKVPKTQIEKWIPLKGVSKGEVRIKMWNGDCLYVPMDVGEVNNSQSHSTNVV